MATEIEDSINRGTEAYIRRTQGAAVDPLGLAIMKVSPGYEEYVMSLPEQEQGDDTPIQNPETGEFYFMMDYDGLGEAPLA